MSDDKLAVSATFDEQRGSGGRVQQPLPAFPGA
jgi:hypothetical protein